MLVAQLEVRLVPVEGGPRAHARGPRHQLHVTTSGVHEAGEPGQRRRVVQSTVGLGSAPPANDVALHEMNNESTAEASGKDEHAPQGLT